MVGEPPEIIPFGQGIGRGERVEVSKTCEFMELVLEPKAATCVINCAKGIGLNLCLSSFIANRSRFIVKPGALSSMVLSGFTILLLFVNGSKKIKGWISREP